MGPSPFLESKYQEAELTEKEFALRVEFVRFYVRSRDPRKACLSLGFMEAYASDWAIQFMNEGVVQRLIQAEDAREDTPEASVARKRMYRAMMEDAAMDRGPGSSHGARVSAITQLMKIEGMDYEAPAETTKGGPAGGVMLVPALGTADDWCSVAMQSQHRLKQTVRD